MAFVTIYRDDEITSNRGVFFSTEHAIYAWRDVHVFIQHKIHPNFPNDVLHVCIIFARFLWNKGYFSTVYLTLEFAKGRVSIKILKCVSDYKYNNDNRTKHKQLRVINSTLHIHVCTWRWTSFHSIRRVRMRRIYSAKVRVVNTDSASLRGSMPSATAIRRVNTRFGRRGLIIWPWRSRGLCLCRFGCTVYNWWFCFHFIF